MSAAITTNSPLFTTNQPSLATRLRDRIAGLSGDGGFTLLETLAVMVIVGLLAAITIPQLSKWREKSYKSDAHNLGLAVEAAYVDTNAYPATVTISDGLATIAGGDTLKVNNNVSFKGAPSLGDTGPYTLVGTDGISAGTEGFAFTLEHTKTTKTVSYNSVLGGIQ
jgi:prepilin-type N-terminal cleavage/methylation domain-containing protein